MLRTFFLIEFLGHLTSGYLKHLETKSKVLPFSTVNLGSNRRLSGELYLFWVIPRRVLQIAYFHILLLCNRDETVILIERNLKSSALSYEITCFGHCISQPGLFSKFYGSWGQMTLNSSSTCNQNSSHSRAHTTGCVWKHLKAKYKQHSVHFIVKHYTGICLAPKPGKPSSLS